jgi:predicted  nucleic acid-binding Zn-ribbon protein
MGRRFWGGCGYYPAVPAYSNYGSPVNWSAPTKEQELTALKQQAANLEQSLADIRKRIEELGENS